MDSENDENSPEAFIIHLFPRALTFLLKHPVEEVDAEIVKEVIQSFIKTSENNSIDCGFLVILLLRTFELVTKQRLWDLPEVKGEIITFLDLCLNSASPTLRFENVWAMDTEHGYPINQQTMCYFALRAIEKSLKECPEVKERCEMLSTKIKELRDHVRLYYWVDHTMFKAVTYPDPIHPVIEKFRNNREAITDGLSAMFKTNFIGRARKGGYFVAEVCLWDYTWLLFGNCMAILSSLATDSQTASIMSFIEERWDVLIVPMESYHPLYPPVFLPSWKIVSDSDKWNKHNGGYWKAAPMWLLVFACIKAHRTDLAEKAFSLITDTKSDDYTLASLMIKNPDLIEYFSIKQDDDAEDDDDDVEDKEEGNLSDVEDDHDEDEEEDYLSDVEEDHDEDKEEDYLSGDEEDHDEEEEDYMSDEDEDDEDEDEDM